VQFLTSPVLDLIFRSVIGKPENCVTAHTVQSGKMAASCAGFATMFGDPSIMRHISMLSAALESIEGRSESLTRQLCSTQTELASCKARYQTCFAAASSFHLCLFATAGSIPIVFHISHSRHDQVMLRCNGVRRVQVDRFRGVCRHHVSTAGCQHDRAAGTATRGAQVLGTLAVIMLHRYTGMVGKHISGSGMAVSGGGYCLRGAASCTLLSAKRSWGAAGGGGHAVATSLAQIDRLARCATVVYHACCLSDFPSSMLCRAVLCANHAVLEASKLHAPLSKAHYLTMLSLAIQ
jgi:hypothetical protein